MVRPDEPADRAVTPVIGVILVVAIVVILAAVVGVYALSFGDAGTESPPNVRFGATYDERTTPNGQYLNVTVQGGERARTDELEFVVNGATNDSGATNPLTGDPLDQIGDDLVTVDTISLNATSFDTDPVDLGDATVHLVWDPDPDSSDPGETHSIWNWESD